MRAAAGRGTDALSRIVPCALVAFAALLHANDGDAHPLAPALLEVEARQDGLYDVRWKTSRLRPRGSQLEPALPPLCQPTGTTGLEEDAASITLAWQVDCGDSDLTAETISIEGLDSVAIDVLVRLSLADGRRVSAVLGPGNRSLTVPGRQSRFEVFRSYVWLGFEHILGGPDHLLFVLGLLLLVVRARPLIQTITAFTLGHSVTLSLVTLDLVRVPSGPVELLIAISVLVLAVELASPDPDKPSVLRRRPWLMASTFGLLHGLGFAGALAEIGLPQEEIPMALFSFNVGIELGQIAFVGAIAAAVALLRRPMARLPLWAARVPAYGIGILAAFWCYERAAELL